MDLRTAAASSLLRLRPIGATVARQIPVLKVTRSNRVSVTEEALQLVDDAPTVHPQEYDTDKGGGQLYYVISAKRRHYYEYMLGDLIIDLDA